MANQGITGRDLRNTVLFAAFLYLVFRFISQIIDILLIFSITALLAVALNPAVSWLEKRRVPRSLSAGVLALATIALIALILYLIIPPAIEQITDLWSQAPDLLLRVRGWFLQLQESYPRLAGYLPSDISIDRETIQQVGSSIIGGASRITASLVGALTATFVVFISTIYVLANPRPLIEGFLKLVGPDRRGNFIRAGERISAQIVAWVQAAAIGMFLIFILTWVGLSIIGMKQAFLFGIIAGLLEIVPIIGPIVAAVPPTLVALLQNPVTAIWVVVLFTAIQQIEGNVILPLVMSKQLSLHPVTVIFAVLVMGGLFGIIGVFLAAPAAFTAGIIYEEIFMPEQKEIKEREEEQEESAKQNNCD